MLEGHEMFFIKVVDIFEDQSLEIDPSHMLKTVEIQDSKSKPNSTWCIKSYIVHVIIYGIVCFITFLIHSLRT